MCSSVTKSIAAPMLDRAAPMAVPERAPDQTVEQQTLPWQALLYRLSGDGNLLHADPEVARDAGFERPILHGLCTHGFVLRAAIDAGLADLDRISTYEVRFSGVVYPGDVLRSEAWLESDSTVLMRTSVSGRDRAVATARLQMHPA